MQTNKPVVYIVGPTASGKTGFSIEIAKRFNGEIISGDSMQIYKNMHIASAAPDEEELEEALKGAHMVIADPMYQPICTEVPVFIPLPKEAFSGRLYRKEIPNLVTDLHVITDKMGK